MLFNSYVFIYLFFPTVFAGYFLLNHFHKENWSKGWLVLASLYFYSYFKLEYLPLILISIAGNYILSGGFDKFPVWKRCLFIIAIVFNLGILGIFKYADFISGNLNTLFGTHIPLLNVVLPLGVSFYTFQQISYIVDRYRGEDKYYTFMDYALFVTFFPQLIAGPIVLPKEMLPQFEDKKKKRVSWQHLHEGLFLFSVGLAKKCFIADTLALMANAGFNTATTLNATEAWLSALAYTFQLYFDFSGYCDMAMGIGKCFNIELPLNFNSPYKSGDFQEFWRRWHMTLGRFMMTYLYIPLGGNRSGEIRTLVNLLVVFVASGLWHGAGWTFFVWGGLHGMSILIHRIWKRLAYGKICPQNGLPVWVSIPLTFFFVNLYWVFFRAENMEKALGVVRSLFLGKWVWVSERYAGAVQDSVFILPRVLVILGLGILIVFVFPNAAVLYKRLPPWMISGLSVVLFMLGFLFAGRIAPFLYFNF